MCGGIVENRVALGRFLGLLVLCTIWSISAEANPVTESVNKDPCNDEWQQVLARYPKVEDRIEHWAALSRCAHSGIYESRLSALYNQAGMFKKARKLADAGLTLHTPYRKELLSNLAGVDLSELKLDTALRKYEAIIKHYPDWYDGYGGVGTVKLMQNKFDEAVQFLNEAVKREHEEHYYIYRNLTLAYHKLGVHEEVVKAINTAYALNKNVVRDRDAMLCAARSYALLGKYKVANGLLGMLLQARPEVGTDPEVVRVARFVSRKLKEEPRN